MEEARDWLAKFLAFRPGISIAGIRDGQPAKDASRLAAILEGLRLAGLQEVSNLKALRRWYSA